MSPQVCFKIKNTSLCYVEEAYACFSVYFHFFINLFISCFAYISNAFLFSFSLFLSIRIISYPSFIRVGNTQMW